MATVLLLFLFLIEAGFVVYTLTKQKSRREWIRNRLIVNGVELLFYISMTLLPGIDFSFRFKALFWLLIIRVIISGIRFLIKYRKAEGENKKVSLISGSVLICVIILLSMVPAFLFADYNGLKTSGSYDVAEKNAILIDNSRIEEFENDGSKREIPIYFYYPVNAGENEVFPLVIFSHGAFGYYQSNTSTYMELASNGYVVVSMEHPYHSTFTKDTDGKMIIADRQFLNDAMYIGSADLDEIMNEQRFEVTSVWMKLRTTDMNFAIDTIKSAVNDRALSKDTWVTQNEDEILGILNHIDCSKIGLMGHSMGGATAVTVGRQRDDISAVVDIDGTMLGEELGVKDGKFVCNEEPYPVPLLSMGNMEHGTDEEIYGDDYVNTVIMKNARNAQNTYIVNSGHMNFTDLPLFSPFLASQLGTGEIDATHCMEIVNDLILNFMNSNLKGDGSYRVQEFYE